MADYSDENTQNILDNLEELEREFKTDHDPAGYYAQLGLATNATQKQIRQAFLHLSRTYHTDKHVTQTEEIQELMNNRFQLLYNAYTVLSDERSRAAYDASGATGVNLLQLVPAEVTQREEILQTVRMLERQALVAKQHKLLSSSSKTSMQFSVVPLMSFLPSMRRPQIIRSPIASRSTGPSKPDPSAQAPSSSSPASPSPTSSGGAAQHAPPANTPPPPPPPPPQPPQPVEEKKEEGGGGSFLNKFSLFHASNNVNTAKPEEKNKVQETAPSTKPDVPESVPAPEAPAPKESPPADSFSERVNATAMELNINGVPTVVLIPSQDMQNNLRSQMMAQQRQNAGADGAASNAPAAGGRAIQQRRRPTFFDGIKLCAIPRTIVFEHSFQHAITPALTATISVGGKDGRDKRKSQGRVGVLLEYQRSAVENVALNIKWTVAGIKAIVMQNRALNRLWTLKTKVIAVNGAELLSKLEMTLVRKLSRCWSLTNTLCWSLGPGGYFSSSIARSVGSSSLVGYMLLSANTMAFTVYRNNECQYDALCTTPDSAKGAVEQSIAFSPLTATANISMKFWLFQSTTQQFGVGFTSTLPFTFLLPYMEASSGQGLPINLLTLLYNRGEHRISIPIGVTTSPHIFNSVLWLSTPVLLYKVVTRATAPWRHRRLVRWCNEERLKHVVELDVARARAINEQKAVEQQVLKLRVAEEQVPGGGLVIANAKYGVLNPKYVENPKPNSAFANAVAAAQRNSRNGLLSPVSPQYNTSSFASTSPRDVATSSSPQTPAAGETPQQIISENADDGKVEGKDISLVLDVTVALQSLVQDSKLFLPDGTKARVIGFYDPDPFTPEKKQLVITYWFQRTKHVAVFEDDETVELPKLEHVVASTKGKTPRR